MPTEVDRVDIWVWKLEIQTSWAFGKNKVNMEDSWPESIQFSFHIQHPKCMQSKKYVDQSIKNDVDWNIKL